MPVILATTTRSGIRRSLLVASVACLYIALADRLLADLYVRGIAQTLLCYCIGLSSLIQLPGFWAVQVLDLRYAHHTTTAGWLVLLQFNFLLYFVFTLALCRAAAWWRRRGKPLPTR